MSKFIVNTCHDLLIKKPNLLTVDDIVLNHQLDKMNSGDILLFSGRWIHDFMNIDEAISVVTANLTTANRQFLTDNDFLGNPENRVVVDFPVVEDTVASPH